MANSNPSSRKPKPPKKPHPDFPLYSHLSGQWAKKVKGKVWYFGRWDADPKGVQALERWLRKKDDLLAGREPDREDSKNIKVRDLCNQFLTKKEKQRDRGELSPRTFCNYYNMTRAVVKCLGKTVKVKSLQPKDFAKLREELSETRSAVSLKAEIGRIRTLFSFAEKNRLIKRPVWYGEEFDKPRAEIILRDRENKRSQGQSKMLEADEIRQTLQSASCQLKAMILLAVNIGFGNNDVSSLPIRHVDLETGWVTFPRVKNVRPRRIPLWPETVAAIRNWLAIRREPRNQEDTDLVFMTPNRIRWVRLGKGGNSNDSLTQEFRKILTKEGLYRKGLSFYALRHVFATIGHEAKDPEAVDSCMGHSGHGMRDVYRERISDERLVAVTETIRRWLFDTPEASPEKEANHSGNTDTAPEILTDEEVLQEEGPRLKLFPG